MLVIPYLAGHSADASLKRFCCEACANLLVINGRVLDVKDISFISDVTKEGLKYPQPFTVIMVLAAKLAVEKLSAPANMGTLLKSSKQRSLVTGITLSLL